MLDSHNLSLADIAQRFRGCHGQRTTNFLQATQLTQTDTDVVLHGPYTRKIRVLSIGAGVTGIMNAYHIQKQLENVEHVIYEKNADVGGTWYENK